MLTKEQVDSLSAGLRFYLFSTRGHPDPVCAPLHAEDLYAEGFLYNITLLFVLVLRIE